MRKKVTGKLVPPGKRCDCENGIRPCPFIFCRYHLSSNIRKSGLLEINAQDSEYSCVLDVVEANGCVSLPEIGKLMNITMERVRQIELNALNKIQEVWDENDTPEDKTYDFADRFFVGRYGRAG